MTGPDAAPTGTRLEDRFERNDGQVHLTGMNAIVRLLVDQVRTDRARGIDAPVFVSGYEGSPLAGLDLELARNRELLERHSVRHQPGVNEELGVTAVIGTQLVPGMSGAMHDGVIGVWYGKAPGLDRSCDAIRHANFFGTTEHGGILLLVGDDPACKSSNFPSASEHLLSDVGVPVLYPADQSELVSLGLEAIALSRETGLCVALKIVTSVADGSSTVHLGSPESADIALPSGPATAAPRAVDAVLRPGRAMELERTLFDERIIHARRRVHERGLNEIIGQGPANQIGLVACGPVYLELLHALGVDPAHPKLPPELRMLRVRAPWPLATETVAEFADGLQEIVVVEDKRPFVESQLKELLYGRAGAPSIHGKTDAAGRGLFPTYGELDADSIRRVLAPYLADRGVTVKLPATPPTSRTLLPLLARTPFFCSGCPHNRSVKVPEGSLVGAGIGCHVMSIYLPEQVAGEQLGVLQMGGEGAAWIGMAPYLDREHIFQNLGDGTFFHSGSLAIRAAVAAGVNVTYKLLYNSAVAMTGGQKPAGERAVPDVAWMLASEGVTRIVITTDEPGRYRRVALPKIASLRPRDQLAASQAELAALPGVTVLIHDQECAAERSRKRRRGLVPDPPLRLFVNDRICENCGDCTAKANCLSLGKEDTEFGEKTVINQTTCNKDYSCADGDCPSFVSVLPGKKARGAAPVIDVSRLPDPEPVFDIRSRIRIVGVGGTGIITVAQVLSVAAWVEGKGAHALDQTGMSQKAGAVVSDVTLTRGTEAESQKLAAGECDVYLACDALAGAADRMLAVSDPARTRAVVNTNHDPTGTMISEFGTQFPDMAELVGRIHDRARNVDVIDAGALSRARLGNELFANVLVLGVAYQRGYLPVQASSIERALEMNGTAVTDNVAAFRLGRLWAHAPGDLVMDRPHPGRERAPDSADDRAASLLAAAGEINVAPFADRVRTRIADLVRYQNERYARSYLRFVSETWVAEQAHGGNGQITEAVMLGLYKLMAFKDEFEVARLALDGEVKDKIAASFGSDARVAWQLHPPVLRALGLSRKLSLGPWFGPVFRLLYAFRWVRFTPLNIFGYSHVRRIEKSLPRRYQTDVRWALDRLSDATTSAVLGLAQLPDVVRGYESIKLRGVAVFEQRSQEFRASILDKAVERGTAA